ALLAASSLRCNGTDVQPTDPTTIAMISGDGQTGTAGHVLANPLVVEVTDKSGNAVPGVSVSWSAQGGGSVSSATVQTGSNGKASIQRTLGSTLGEQATTATVTGLDGSPVTFLATVVTGAPGISVVTQPPPSALSGEVFDPTAQPVISVADDGGSPLSGVTVAASVTSGSLEGTTTATTNAGGIATFGDLGIRGAGSSTIKFTAGTASTNSDNINISALPNQATVGAWGPLVTWDIVPLHMSLMPNGKIITWGKTDVLPDTMGVPRIWDPTGGPPTSAPKIPVDTMLFCAGFALMPDGTLLVSGGHLQDDRGIATTRIFTQDGGWSPGNNMAHGRWYPTVTVLPDGRALTMAGRDQSKTVVTTPELWDGTNWTQLTGAGALEIPYYPRNFVDPKNGMVFNAGERIDSRWFDVTGQGRWLGGPPHIYRFNRDYGSAVMYETGKILVVGGGGNPGWPTPDPTRNVPTATAEIIDLNAGTPTWVNTSPMANPRRHMNATILPDGQVLATGGTRGGGFVDINPGDAVKVAELWNPKTGQWTSLSSASKMRVYHSVSMLLPDGTVLHGSSGDAIGDNGVPVPSERNHEIFSPPYLFKGTRPRITSAPAAVSHGDVFEVATPNKAQVTDVRWIRLGAVTHAFDAGQLANTLSFTPTASGVSITAPANPNIAPGYYMLFILNRNGVPSEGKIIKFQ
ncbi:MAG TPA: galactose oxidase-like domain-containing protein, partial [Gemmatimonadales bacterium]|nr:galactose oxidase-like domain-containing protein [Gemmatimonadales bacterium]